MKENNKKIEYDIFIKEFIENIEDDYILINVNKDETIAEIIDKGLEDILYYIKEHGDTIERIPEISEYAYLINEEIVVILY